MCVYIYVFDDFIYYVYSIEVNAKFKLDNYKKKS